MRGDTPELLGFLLFWWPWSERGNSWTAQIQQLGSQWRLCCPYLSMWKSGCDHQVVFFPALPFSLSPSHGEDGALAGWVWLLCTHSGRWHRLRVLTKSTYPQQSWQGIA